MLIPKRSRADQPERTVRLRGQAGRHAELRPVTLGQRQGDQVVVTDGVAADDRVVVTGQMTSSARRQGASCSDGFRFQ